MSEHVRIASFQDLMGQLWPGILWSDKCTVQLVSYRCRVWGQPSKIKPRYSECIAVVFVCIYEYGKCVCMLTYKLLLCPLIIQTLHVFSSPSGLKHPLKKVYMWADTYIHKGPTENQHIWRENERTIKKYGSPLATGSWPQTFTKACKGYEHQLVANTPESPVFSQTPL